jgi:CubicO group peptidase (beta-lactamase class C family)
MESMAARSGNGVSGRVVIGGSVAEGFEPVQAAFESNFRDHDELGASVALYRGAEPLVDLWGGYRDVAGTRPWERDTMVLVYSTSKGLAGLAVAVAHSRGLLDFEERVATYWPEFAQHGKGAITVRQLLSHQAGLPAVDERLDAGVMADLDRMESILARQRPAWAPGTRHGYHGLSLGWYENELIRRVDPAHRSLGRFFHDELAVPLGLDFHIGLPADIPESRVAEIDGFTALQMLLHLNAMPAGMVLAYMWPGSLVARTMGNPKLRSPADINRPEYRRVEWPAGNGIGTVRSIAKAYAEFASGGGALGIRPETLRALEEPTPPPSGGTRDLILKVDTCLSMGMMKPSPSFRFGSSERAYGTIGTGGSFGFADPDTGTGFAYAPNRHGFHVWDDPREKALRDAVVACL